MYTCLHTSGRTSEIDPIILYSYNPDTCGTEHKWYKQGQALTAWVPCAFYTHLYIRLTLQTESPSIFLDSSRKDRSDSASRIHKAQIGHFLIWPKHVRAAEKGMIFQGLEQGTCLFGPEAFKECEDW